MRFSMLPLFAMFAVLSVSPSWGDDPPQEAKPSAREPWRALGRVTDLDGRPMPGVEISAHCGMGSLHRTGLATTGEDGRYEMDFGPGFLTQNGPGTQAATISAHKTGFSEANLNRQGGCIAAGTMPDEKTIQSWGGRKNGVFLPGKPLELNFVMRPSASVKGKVVDDQGHALSGYTVSLIGADLPPSTSVMASEKTDEQGRFALDDIPTNFRYQFEVRKANPRPPWDDSWASAAMRFEKPGNDDLHAWFGDREIRLNELVIRVEGPGMHDRFATPIAGNAGVLDLTADDPSDVTEKTETKIVAKTAMLTLRNTSRPDVRESLITESIPAPVARESPSRMTRSRMNEDGECVISFENPRGMELEPGKNQVVFQVVIGASEKPIRKRIFRQIDARREGRYEVPVTIPPDAMDDTRVSITFLTVQPDHDAWIDRFFNKGQGGGYKGIWQSDNDLLPTIPYVLRDTP